MLNAQEVQEALSHLADDFGQREGPKRKLFEDWLEHVTNPQKHEWAHPTVPTIRKHLDSWIRNRI